MKTLVAIPMKALEQAKSRMAPALNGAERQRLALDLFERTLHFLAKAFPQFDIAVVTACAHIAAHAERAGARALREDVAAGLNAAAGMAARWAVAHGYDRFILIPADIPVLLRDEIEHMLALAAQCDVAIAEARDGGTNLLLLSPPRDLPFQYGAGSAQSHEAMASAYGLRARRCYLPFLGHDLDTPADCLVLTQKQQLELNGVAP